MCFHTLPEVTHVIDHDPSVRMAMVVLVNEEFEDKIWRNTSIHSVIPLFTMNESINK